MRDPFAVGPDGKYTDESLLLALGDPSNLRLSYLMRNFDSMGDLLDAFGNDKFPPSWWGEVRMCLPQPELSHWYASHLLSRFEKAIDRLVEVLK